MPEVDIDYFKDVRPSNPSGDTGKEFTTSVAQVPAVIPAIPHQEEFSVEPDIIISPIPLALRGIDIQAIETRTQLMQELTKNLPTNELGLPLFIYRPDILNVALIQECDGTDYSPINDMLSAATVKLTYDQGFPTVSNGDPLWSRLQHETVEGFAAFLQYLEQPGARKTSAVNHVAPELVMEWYHQSYWAIRARAYDLYRVAHHTRMREHRILTLNDNHYVEGEKIFAKLIQQLGGKLEDAEAMKELSIPEMISALEKVAKLQRSSVGLSSTGADKSDGPKTPSVEVVMREISSEGRVEKAEENSDISSLLQDPDLLSKAQEVIIKVIGS